jgi:MoaA/NifB/PqqE/SkfB family radical SAM enzyme
MHPGFFDMLRIVKKAGCMAGTTTNATLLDEKIIEKLIEERLDVIGFSLAGIDGENDTIRKGTSLKKTLAGIEALHRAKSKHGTQHPKIHIAFMLLRNGLDNLEKIPAFVANTGADQTVISSLSLAVNAAMESESKLFQRKEDYAHLKHRLMEVKHTSAKLGAEVHFHLVASPLKDFNCSENVSRAMVVGSDGSLSPCVFAQIPACGQNFYYFNGEKKIQQNLSFGNIQTESINLIWHRKAYKEFLHTHLRGQIPAICRHCYQGYIDNFTKI